MKKLILAVALLASSTVFATQDDSNCVGGCTPMSATQDQSQGLTNANSPTFNSSPTMALSGTAVNVNQMSNSFTRMGSIQCPNATLSLTGYGNKNHAMTDYSVYDSRSHGFGVQAGYTQPIGDTTDTCESAQRVFLSDMKFTSLSQKIRMCMDFLQTGLQVSDQFKDSKEGEVFKLCEHFRIMQNKNPSNYRVAQQQVILATEVNTPTMNKTTPKELVGYKEYRLRFSDLEDCNTSCGGVSVKVDQIKKIKSDNENIYLTPYGNSGKVSFYVRGNYLTESSARIAMGKYYSAGVPVRLLGVSGTEIYR